ncbi:MAG: hypothetical protein KBC48_00470 [Candidatus Pacebacteria bacterium]|nr:hypothetical protein [Candidatus Paceibacterota bacterium]
MRVLTVIPITKGFFGEYLTYFTKEEVQAGAVVEVPLRNKPVEALVIESRLATNLKASLRRSDFAIKKVTRVLQPTFFTPAFLEAAQLAADYYAGNIGQIIKSFTPQIILEEWLAKAKKNPLPEVSAQAPENNLEKFKREDFVLQEADAERVGFYKSLIRESFAKEQSVLCLLPTAGEIDKILPDLSRGIEDYTLVLTADLSKKELLSRVEKALNTDHPLLLVITPLFLFLPRTDIKTIIVEREASNNYKDRGRPFADARVLVSYLARAMKAKLIFGDLALRAETIFKTERGELSPISPLKYRAFMDLKQEIIVIGGRKDDKEVKEWPAMSEQLLETVKEATNHGERYFILAGRRGLSPTTVCNDCGLVKSCAYCDRPLVLHEKKLRNGENTLICHQCGFADNKLDVCNNCGSWRLKTLGNGIERIEKALKKHLPKTPIYRVDSDTTKTAKVVKETVEQFLKKPGGILLGTELALNYLNEPVDNTAAVAMDSVLATPDFRVSEKVFSLLLRTRALARKRFIIETRKPEEQIYVQVCQGNLLDFYRDELSERQKLNWPPFITLVKVMSVGLRPRIDKDLAETAALFTDKVRNVNTLLTPAGRPRYFKATIILELVTAKNLPADILTLLRSLPPNWQIEVDPETLF